MQAGLSIYLSDPYGTRLGDASNFVRLQYTRVVNDVGVLKLWLPADFDTNLIRIPDGRIEVWRRIPGTNREYLETETVWIIKALQWDRDDSGNVSLLVEADTPLCILRDPGRVVGPYNNYLLTNTAADDLMKFVMLYQGVTATPSQIGITRADTASYPGAAFGQYITADPNQSQGPTLYTVAGRFVTWKPVLSVLKDIAQASANSGTYLAFDIVVPSADTSNSIQPLVFKTYTQQRGVDHRFPAGINPVIVGGDLGNAGQATLRDDRRKEATVAWAGGAGNPNATPGQLITNPPSYDLTRVGASPFGWKETYINDSQQTDASSLTATATAAVYGGRPRTLYRGRLLSVPGCQYGVHWAWGDYVTVQDFGQSFDARIEAVTVTVEKGQEKVDAWVRNDDG